MTKREYLEMSYAEYQRRKNDPPITESDIQILRQYLATLPTKLPTKRL